MTNQSIIELQKHVAFIRYESNFTAKRIIIEYSEWKVVNLVVRQVAFSLLSYAIYNLRE
jgi:hypothetical protein